MILITISSKHRKKYFQKWDIGRHYSLNQKCNIHESAYVKATWHEDYVWKNCDWFWMSLHKIYLGSSFILATIFGETNKIKQNRLYLRLSSMSLFKSWLVIMSNTSDDSSCVSSCKSNYLRQLWNQRLCCSRMPCVKSH